MSAQETATSPYRLEFLGDINIATGTRFTDIGARDKNGPTAIADPPPRQQVAGDALAGKLSGEFGGVSALAYLPDSQELLALSDTAKPILFVFHLELTAKSFEVTPRRIVPLRDSHGQRMNDWSMDPEALALSAEGDLLIASEGFSAGIERAGVAPQNPAMYRFDMAGVRQEELELPNALLGLASEATGTWRNLGIESLSTSPDRSRLFLAAEGSLKQDGPLATPYHGSSIRLFCRDFGDAPAAWQQAWYRIKAPELPDHFKQPIGNRGLSEILALDNENLLLLERSFFRQATSSSSPAATLQRIEIFHVCLLPSCLSRVRNAPLATAAEPKFCRKTLVLDLAAITAELDPHYRSLDNFEGMCLGPRLPDQSRTLLLVSDNNFNVQQRTAILAFRILEQPGH